MRILDYYQPSTLEEALVCLGRSSGSTKLLAGGTDLIIKIRERSVEAEYIVDLVNVNELKGIVCDGDKLIIGSMVTFAELELNPLIREYTLILAEAAGTVGSPQIRNTATIGGNIANAAAAADSLPPLLALEARVRVQKAGGLREVPIEEILIGVNKTCLLPEEILTDIVIPIPQVNTEMAFVKLGRRKALAIARLNLGLAMNMAGDGKMVKVALALGAVGVSAYRVPQVEELLQGKYLIKDTISDACNLISRVVADKLGSRPTAPYKKSIAGAALHKALEDIKQRQGGC